MLHVKNVESCLGLDPCIGNSLFYEFPHISQFTICNSTFPSFVNKSAENSLSDQEQTNGLNTIPTNLSAIVNEEKGNNMDTTLTILSAFADSDDSDLESNKTSSKTASEEGSLKSKVRRHKKRSPSRLRKNPKAPKRFKSSYICFFVSKQREIKDALGEKSTVRILTIKTFLKHTEKVLKSQFFIHTFLRLQKYLNDQRKCGKRSQM